MASTYTLISSQVLASSAASVTFSAIPATYTDLVLRVSARSDSASQTVDTMKIIINADSTTNYSDTYLYSIGTVGSGRQTSTASDKIMGIDAALSTANTFSSNEIYIPNYNSTTSKPFSSFDVSENNSVTTGNFQIDTAAHLYAGTSAITSIGLSVVTVNFIQYSSFYLYGISSS